MRHGFVALLALLLAASPAVAAKKALFDNTHAETAGNADWVIDDTQPVPSPAQSGITAGTPETYWTGSLSSWGIALVKRGYTVATLTSSYGITYGNASNAYDLSNYDVFVVDEPNTLFTSAEAAAILAFVRDGGGLIAISDHGNSDRDGNGYDSPMIWNAMDPAHLLGVRCQVYNETNNNISQTSTNVNASSTDSITRGPVGNVNAFAFFNGTTLTLYPAVNSSVRGEVWMNGTPQSSTTGVMAASSVYGNGRVVFVCDSSPADDGTASPGNSVYNDWGLSSANDSTLFLNATLWATRRTSSADATAPTVSLTAPNGGEDWKAGSSHAITWTATDDVGVTTVDLAYSTNGGASFGNTIAAGLANSGSYAWTVPNAPGTTLRVRAIAHDAAGNVGSDSSAANFTISTWTITASAGANGSVSPSGSVGVVQGASQGFTITPAAHYHVADVLVDGASIGAVTSTTFTDVTANHTIAASFAPDTYTITASAGANGAILPSGAVVVGYGGTQRFSIVPAVGAHVAALTIDGGAAAADTTYTFTDVSANHTIAASFAADQVALTVVAVGGGTVTRSPDEASYAWGTRVTLSADPAPGWAFAGWSGDTTGTADTLALTLTRPCSLTATFADIAAPVVTVTAPAGGEQWREVSAQTITWTATDNAGVDSVNIDCSTTGPEGPWVWVAHGLANTGSFSWVVSGPVTDAALMRVTAYDAAGNSGADASDSAFTILSVYAGVAGSGTGLALWGPQPNPGPGTTLLRFTLPAAGHVRLEVLDLAGRRLWSRSGEQGAGLHEVRWNGSLESGSRAGAGLYFVRLTTPWGTRTARLAWLR